MSLPESLRAVRALTFDVFGTVVDWRTSLIDDLGAFGRERGIDADWTAFADSWRGLYQPQMETVRTGERPFTKLDVLHRESLEKLLVQFGIQGLSEMDKDHMNRAWHRLRPWPDSVPGLTRMKRKFILATLSNGNVALMVNMARNGGLPWDTILGAEVCRYYKPCPEAYRLTADFLDLPTDQVMLVAAHNDDLLAAQAEGYKTAFVARPTEYGPNQKVDFKAEHDFDLVADSFTALADMLGC